MEIKYHFDMTKIPSKLNPQQTQMVEGLKTVLEQDADNQTLTKEDILTAITPVLVTKQDPWLIFKYYQPTFIETGMLSLDKVNKPKVARNSRMNAGTVTIELQGPPRPPEVVETKEELAEAGW